MLFQLKKIDNFFGYSYFSIEDVFNFFLKKFIMIGKVWVIKLDKHIIYPHIFLTKIIYLNKNCVLIFLEKLWQKFLFFEKKWLLRKDNQQSFFQNSSFLKTKDYNTFDMYAINMQFIVDGQLSIQIWVFTKIIFFLESVCFFFMRVGLALFFFLSEKKCNSHIRN